MTEVSLLSRAAGGRCGRRRLGRLRRGHARRHRHVGGDDDRDARHNTHGVLSYTYGSPTKADYIEFKISLSGGKGSGTMRNNSPVELGNEGPPVCESGIVKFTARHL
jgi:hypothetical protein